MHHLPHLCARRLLHLLSGTRSQIVPLRSERQEPVLRRKAIVLLSKFNCIFSVLSSVVVVIVVVVDDENEEEEYHIMLMMMMTAMIRKK